MNTLKDAKNIDIGIEFNLDQYSGEEGLKELGEVLKEHINQLYYKGKYKVLTKKCQDVTIGFVKRTVEGKEQNRLSVYLSFDNFDGWDTIIKHKEEGK